ncbi:MAG: FAD-binding oxidoreductase [Candidatus Wildermuthbacteria bacterium]|nr:FAD-binding oxidoreductase [Candidatus Wildermuthbacteria bacterium]
MNLKEELQRILKGEVMDDEETLKKYSTDASIFEIKPRIVVFPEDKKDIQRLVVFVNEHPKEKLSITCRAAGTDMSGGPLNDSIIVDFTKHMNKLLDVGEDYAIVEPGMLYKDFSEEIKQRNLLFPSYPASKDMCAIGGMLANNSGGEKSLAYGKTENYVNELTVILRDGKEYTLRPLSKRDLAAKLRKKDLEGELYGKIHDLTEKNYDALQAARPKVSKNSAGYYLWNVWDKKTFNLIKLFIGSQGTLGIIVEAKLKLVVPKKHSAVLVVFMRNLDPLVSIVQKVLEGKPESFESYDDHTLKLALKYFFELVKLIGAKNIFSLGLRFLPEVTMLITGGLPKLVLLGEFTGDTETEAAQKAKEARASLRGFGLATRIAKKPQDIEKYFTIRRQSFNLLRHHIKNKKSSPFIDDIIVQPEKLPQFLPELNAILGQYPKLIYTIAGHVGDGNFHIIPLVDLRDSAMRRIIPELEKKVHDLVFKYQGSMTAEHNDGIIRTPYLKQMYGAAIVRLFEETKKIFDPNTIFNPRKKIGADVKYLAAHIMEHN